MPSTDVRGRRRRAAIIGAALVATALLFSGCGVAIRLAYNQAPSLAFRWIDGYVDLDDAQSLRTRQALDDFFAWHRRTQLPDYANLLARAEGELAGDVTGERMCAFFADVRQRAETAFERALPAVADVVVTMKPQQIANVEKKYAERNEDWRDDYLQKNPAKRQRAAYEREVDRAENLYGRLDEAQRDLVTKAVAASPFEAERSYAERLRRQQDVLASIRKLSAPPGASRAEAETEIRALVGRVDRSPREDYRAYSQKVVDYNCAFAASLHNATTPAQRKRAIEKLKGYEGELRALAAPG